MTRLRVVSVPVSVAGVYGCPRASVAPQFCLVRDCGGRRRTYVSRLGKRVGLTPSRVQIPYPPPRWPAVMLGGRSCGSVDEAAKGIEELRDKIDAMVAGGAAVTIGVGLITFGVGSAVAGAATAGGVVVTTSVVISFFLTRVAIVAAFEFVGGYITSISLQALRQQIFDPGKPINRSISTRGKR